MSLFEYPIRVYYEDTDCTGIVYHTNYLKFMERARSEWLAGLKVNEAHLFMEEKAFAIRELQVAFKIPARLNDPLIVQVYLKKIKRASIVFYHEIVHALSRKLYCTATVEVVCINNKIKPCPLPNDLLTAILPEET